MHKHDAYSGVPSVDLVIGAIVDIDVVDDNETLHFSTGYLDSIGIEYCYWSHRAQAQSMPSRRGLLIGPSLELSPSAEHRRFLQLPPNTVATLEFKSIADKVENTEDKGKDRKKATTLCVRTEASDESLLALTPIFTGKMKNSILRPKQMFLLYDTRVMIK